MNADKPGREQLSGYRLRDYDELITMLARSRESQGVTQVQLATRMGVHQSSVSDWLSGRTAVHRERLFEIADALGYGLALIPREDA